MVDMNEGNPNTAGRPHRLVSVVLLMILLACLGWAGLIVQRRTGEPRRAGESILEAIARDGLDRALPPATGAVEWFLSADPEGNVVGCEAYRHVRGPGGHSLVSLFYRGKPQEMTLEVWTIANDLSTSEYRAASGLAPARLYTFPGSAKGAAPFDAPDLTFIDQAKGQVTVRRRMARHVAEATAPAPGNLIPEGATYAAVRYVARQQRPASFYSISNEQAIGSGRLLFTTVRMRPVAKDCVEVTQSIPGAGDQLTRWYLDSGGNIAKVGAPGLSMPKARATRGQVLRYFTPAAVRAAEETVTALTSAPLSTRPTTTTAPRPATVPPIEPVREAPPPDAAALAH